MESKTKDVLEQSRDGGPEILWNPRVVKSLYLDEGMIMTEIAEHVGANEETVRRWVDRHGIEHRHGHHSQTDAPIYMNPYGYETWHVDENTVLVHRLLLVAEHGVQALDGMHVHHRNEIPWDNRPANLELLSQAEHNQHHAYSRDEAPPEGF